jgi:hypothetical protein
LVVMVLGLELRGYTLSHSTSFFFFFCDGFIEMGLTELFAQVGFKL